MEKIVMYLKKVIILLCGIVLGYLTSRRTDMSISLECILGDGVFIVLVITIIMVITKEKIKLGINCAIFGLSFVIGSTWIKNIELFFEFGKQNYDYILCGLGEAIIIPVIFGGLGIILYYYHKEGTKQQERDKLKDRILEKYEVPLIRLSTAGSGEKKILEEKIREIFAN